MNSASTAVDVPPRLPSIPRLDTKTLHIGVDSWNAQFVSHVLAPTICGNNLEIAHREARRKKINLARGLTVTGMTDRFRAEYLQDGL
jgi:hypothetical protein